MNTIIIPVTPPICAIRHNCPPIDPSITGGLIIVVGTLATTCIVYGLITLALWINNTRHHH